MKKREIRVLIADDHSMVRSGLRLFLMAFEDFKLVGEAANGQETLRFCATEKPDVVLMDMIMPGMDGIRATREIRSRFPGVQILGLTSYIDANMIRAMISAGAVGFVMKNISAAELAAAIRNAQAGKAVFSAEIQEILKGMVSSTQDIVNATRYHLSAREREVLACLAAGMSNAEIAQELVISLSTAKYHVSSVLAKLQVENRSQAVSLALQERLVDPSMPKKR